MTRQDVEEMLQRGEDRVRLTRCLSPKFKGKDAKLISYDAWMDNAVVLLDGSMESAMIDPSKLDRILTIPDRKPEWKPGDEVLLFGMTRYLTRPSPSGRGMWFVATVPTHPAVEVEIHERYFGPAPRRKHETRTSYDLAPPGEREWAPGAMAYTEKFSAGPALVTLVERNECHERCWLVEPGDDGEGNAFLYEDEFRRARPQDIARPTRAPNPTPKADAYSTVLGAVAWREQDRINRRLHIALTDGTDSVSLWATTLRPLRDREIRLARHLPAAEVPAVLDGLMMSPDDRPAYPTGLDILMEEVG